MTFDEYFVNSHHNPLHYSECGVAFKAGAASRDAYIERLETGLLQVRKALCGDIHNTDDLLDLIASRDAEVAELKKELYAISVALDDPRTDLTMTMVEVITDQHKERDQLREQVTLLREALRDCAYDECGFCINPDAAEALAATEPRSTK